MGVCGSKGCCGGACACCGGCCKGPVKEAPTDKADGVDTRKSAFGEDDPLRPASGTVKRDDEGSKVGCSRLSLKIEQSTTALQPVNGHGSANGVVFESPTNEGEHLLAVDDKQYDPFALNRSPTGQPPPKLESVAMFVPFENTPSKPVSRSTSRNGATHSRSSTTRKGKRVKSRYKDAAASAKRSADAQSFIPGTGGEKMLLAGSGKKKALKPLNPINFKKEAKASASIRQSISKDRSRASVSKSMGRRLDRYMKETHHLPSNICTLIRKYAEIEDKKTASKGDFEFQLVEKEQGHPSGLPTAPSSLPQAADPWKKKTLF